MDHYGYTTFSKSKQPDNLLRTCKNFWGGYQLDGDECSREDKNFLFLLKVPINVTDVSHQEPFWNWAGYTLFLKNKHRQSPLQHMYMTICICLVLWWRLLPLTGWVYNMLNSHLSLNEWWCSLCHFTRTSPVTRPTKVVTHLRWWV